MPSIIIIIIIISQCNMHYRRVTGSLPGAWRLLPDVCYFGVITADCQPWHVMPVTMTDEGGLAHSFWSI